MRKTQTNTQTNTVDVNDILSIINGSVSAIINKHLNRKFKTAELNITTEQWGVLICLWKQDKQTQQAISDSTNKDKASITRLLDSLEKNSLIERKSDPSDRRINMIHLTDLGKEIEIKAMALVQEEIEIAFAEIDQREILRLKEILIKVLTNLD